MVSFKKGISIDEHKDTSKVPITKLEAGQTLVFPTNQHLGNYAKPIVKKGDYVLMGQTIAEADGFISADLISSVSGTVKDVSFKETAKEQYIECITIENDFLYNKIENYGKENDIKKMIDIGILSIIKQAGIVGLGGSGFPTWAKLTQKDPDAIEYVLLNGAECEPYLTCDDRIMVEETDYLLDGVSVILKLFKNAKAIICIEENKKEAYERVLAKSREYKNIDVLLMKTKYPQGAERMLLYSALKKVINLSILPAEVHCLVQNVGTAVAISKAVHYGIPLVDKVITIAGDAFDEGFNVRVPIGMPIGEVIEKVGGFKRTPGKIINGGPMMGSSIYDLSMPITKNTSAILAFTDDSEVVKKQLKNVETRCINCGKCVESCPINLMPKLLYRIAKNNDKEGFMKLHGQECINCATCTYVCPSKKPLNNFISNMKRRVRKHDDNKKAVEVLG